MQNEYGQLFGKCFGPLSPTDFFVDEKVAIGNLPLYPKSKHSAYYYQVIVMYAVGALLFWAGVDVEALLRKHLPLLRPGAIAPEVAARHP